MKLPLSWIKEYIEIDKTPEEIAQILTMAGIEVDKIETSSPAFSGVAVVKILSVSPHSNAERLRLAQVTDGVEHYQIVCGAPNCREGIKTALAKIGAELPEGEGKSFKIKKAKIRDIESFGMLCTEKELSLSDHHDGIMEFGEEMPVGTDLAAYFSETILEISLTPNLGHCMSVLGIARELSIFSKKPLIKKIDDSQRVKTSVEIDQMISVAVEDTLNCSRYSCCIVTDLKVTASPAWLQKRLEASGIRSINVLVDIGNYVMLEYGQPLHLFDYEKIHGKKLKVSSPSTSPPLLALDEELREVPPNTLLISDEQGAVAIAGIIGSKDSAVSEQTTQVLIEAAHFNATSIRRSSKLMKLRTEASSRFERETDPAMTIASLNRAAELLHQLAGGKIIPGYVDIQKAPIARRQIHCRPSRINALLGLNLSHSEVLDAFNRLQLEIVEESAATQEIILSIPTYRNDLMSEIDLVEEIARLYGYNNFPCHPPKHISSTIPPSQTYLFESSLRNILLEQGLQECITCNLISPFLAELSIKRESALGDMISVLQPRSIDQSVLRSSMLPGLLQVIKNNLDHQVSDISAFEIGKIHFKTREQMSGEIEFHEQLAAGIILCGKSSPHHIEPKVSDVDFLDLKGRIENLLDALGIRGVTYEPSHLHNFHPFRQARIKVKDITLGTFGEIHPRLLAKMDTAKRVYYAEVSLHDLFPLKKQLERTLLLPSYPSTERDWTVTLKDEMPMQTIFQAIDHCNSSLLERFFLLDLYYSDKVKKETKNATFRFIYRDLEKTLSAENAEKEHEQITQEVAKKLRDWLC